MSLVVGLFGCRAGRVSTHTHKQTVQYVEPIRVLEQDTTGVCYCLSLPLYIGLTHAGRVLAT